MRWNNHHTTIWDAIPGYTADVAVGAYDIPNIATGYNNGNPVDCQIGCAQQFNAPYVFMYGTYCYCQVREFEFDIHQPGGGPVDNSFCTTPCFVDPNAPCGTLSDTDAGSPDIIDSTWELEHLYNIEVFGSLFICPKPGHFKNFDLFYEPKQHGSRFGVHNVYIYHNSEARNVHIHKNNRQYPTVFCEPVLVPRLL
ncbi:hypothetical protein N0V92_001020 [Colletotrichum tropicale]|nr:hypothetical protein N0V92_001020 [Colletotrichum tropicale]